MSRVSYSCLKFSLYFLCSFIVGFVLGTRYWQTVFQIRCSLSGIPRTTVQEQYSFYEHFEYRTIKTCQNANSKIFLTIAILSSHERLLIYLPSMLETWMSITTIDIEMIIFVEEKSSVSEDFIQELFFQLNKNQTSKSCLFIVKLKHVQNEYPPQKKSFYAMKFMYQYYRERTSWLLRLDDNAYVNVEELAKWLTSIEHRRPLYIGQSGAGRQNGPAIHFPPGQYFCMGGSGVILSQPTLVQLGPWLDECLKNEIRTKHEDVELGRCILTHVNISCSHAYNLKSLFYHHYGPHYLFGSDFTPSIVSQAFIIHPIKNQTTFRQVFSFYLRQKEERQHVPDSSLKKLINRQNYITFLAQVEFDLVRDIHHQLIDARWRFYIEEVVRSYIEQTRMRWHYHSKNRTLTNGQFVCGYHRVMPSYGLELIVEILINARSVSKSPTSLAVIRKRLHLRQPFSNKRRFDYREIVNIETNESNDQLNLIVVSSNKDEVLLRFIGNFEREVLKTAYRHAHFTLTILYFYQTNQTRNAIVDLIRKLSVRYPSIIRISIIDKKQTSYNRGLGRQLASRLFTNNQLLFFLDVDLVFTGQALDNTRRLMIHQLSISSCTVYFPIVFSGFSNIFVVNNSPTIDVYSKNGLFSIYGFGNVAVRKRDLDRIGGWETNNNDWGVEDVNLFQRFANAASECYVFRAVEPGLRHYYHIKMCNGIMDVARRKMCDDAGANLIGSQANMVDFFIDNKILND